VLGYLTDYFIRFRVVGNGAKGDFNGNVFAISTCTATAAARLPIASEYVPLVLEVNKRPKLVVALKVNMSTATSIASVGAAFGLKLFPSQVCAS
jgi:hypothetical protein